MSKLREFEEQLKKNPPNDGFKMIADTALEIVELTVHENKYTAGNMERIESKLDSIMDYLHMLWPCRIEDEAPGIGDS